MFAHSPNAPMAQVVFLVGFYFALHEQMEPLNDSDKVFYPQKAVRESLFSKEFSVDLIAAHFA
jgi:hypothetical protein